MTEDIINKLNSIGIDEISDTLEFSVPSTIDIDSFQEVLKKEGWIIERIGGDNNTRIVNISVPSEVFIEELRKLGIGDITEELQFSIFQKGIVTNVYIILKSEKFEFINIHRPASVVYKGPTFAGIWDATAKRCLGF